MSLSQTFFSKENLVGRLKSIQFKGAAIKKISVVALFAFIILGAATVFSAPLYSADNMSIPDLSGIKPFSHAANYMSLEGFVIYQCRVNYGVEISRGEARKMIKAQRKAKKAGAAVQEQSNAAEKLEFSKGGRAVAENNDAEKEDVRKRVDEILTRYHHENGR